MPRCVAPGCKDAAGKVGPFCVVHAAAPAGKRGGWISAHRRQVTRGAGESLDASSISRRLWVGAEPPFDRDLPQFQVLVLCSDAIQPPSSDIAFRGTVVRCPMPDAALSPDEVTRALDGGRAVGRALASGKTVLVTCFAGRNRSALVAGLGLGLVTRMTADQIVELIRARRNPGCLNNPFFVKLLKTYVPGPRRQAAL